MKKTSKNLAHADLLFAQGTLLSTRYDRKAALPLFKECAEIRMKHLGLELPTARALYMQARQINSERSLAAEKEKLALLNTARAIFEAKLTDDKSELALVIDQLALIEAIHFMDDDRSAREQELSALVRELVPDVYRAEKALEVQRIEEAIAKHEEVYGKDNLEYASALELLADHIPEREAERKAKLYVLVLEVMLVKVGETHEQVATVRTKLGKAMHRLLSMAHAEIQYREALRIRIALHGIDSLEAWNARKSLLTLWQEGWDLYAQMDAELRKHCPIREEIKAAAKWFADQLRHQFFHTTSDLRCDMMVNLLAGNAQGGLTSEHVDRFQQILEEETIAQLKSIPLNLRVDYQPGKILKEALEKAGLNTRIGILPCKSGVTIEKGKVTAFGGNTGNGVIFGK